MTNEELATKIKAGEKGLILALWSQVERFVWWKALHRADFLDGIGGVTAEDLYQSGFFALLKAVADFDPASGYTFLTYLDRPLRSVFASAAGYRTEKQKRDPLQYYIALDTPAGEDEDGETLGDLQVDPAAELAFAVVEDNELQEKVRQAVECLPEAERAVIRRRYFMNKTLDSQERILERNALKLLRHPRVSKGLSAYVRM